MITEVRERSEVVALACPFTSFRPLDDGKVHVHLPSLGRELVIGRKVFEHLVDDLLNATEFERLSASTRRLMDVGVVCRSDQVDATLNFRDWEENGWGPTIEVFLSSRSSRFSDNGGDYEFARLETFREFSRLEECPSFPEPGADSITLPRGSGIELGSSLLQRSCSERLSKGGTSVDTLGRVLEFGHERSAKNWRPDTDDAGSVFASFGSSFQTLVAVYDCPGINSGTYMYHPDRHCLEATVLSIGANQLYDLTFGHDAPLDASFVVLLTFHEEMAQWRYKHERGLLNVFVELGQISQRLVLSAASCGIKAHITPAVDDYFWDRISLRGFGNLLYVNSFGADPVGRSLTH